MSLVNNKQIIGSGICWLITGGQRLTKSTELTLALEEIKGCYQPWEVSPGVYVDSSLSAQLTDGFAVYNAKFQTEFVPHFFLPLYLQ